MTDWPSFWMGVGATLLTGTGLSVIAIMLMAESDPRKDLEESQLENQIQDLETAQGVITELKGKDQQTTHSKHPDPAYALVLDKIDIALVGLRALLMRRRTIRLTKHLTGRT